jgi:hypothetical protein
MGESSSTSFSLAVALATPHAGVGESSSGEDEQLSVCNIAEEGMCGERWVGRTGEIMTKSSSPGGGGRWDGGDGEGEGESLCLPLERPKETAKGLPGEAMAYAKLEEPVPALEPEEVDAEEEELEDANDALEDVGARARCCI